ncbi:MAG: hypothetical protein ABI321_15940 [Polyangia bacterium]
MSLRLAACFLVYTMGCGGCYYDVAPAHFDLGVVDEAVPALDLAGTDGAVCPSGAMRVHTGELSEMPIDGWGAASIGGSDAGTTDVTFDTRRLAAGAGSLRLETSATQAGLFYPKTRDAAYDLTQQLYVSFSVTADDSSAANDPGWRGSQPHVLVVSTSDDYFEYVPDGNRLPRVPGSFVGLTVPLAGGSGWTRNVYGSPDLSKVKYLAWVFDTWGAGFTLWLDDVRIGPAPFADCGG